MIKNTNQDQNCTLFIWIYRILKKKNHMVFKRWTLPTSYNTPNKTWTSKPWKASVTKPCTEQSVNEANVVDQVLLSYSFISLCCF